MCMRVREAIPGKDTQGYGTHTILRCAEQGIGTKRSLTFLVIPGCPLLTLAAIDLQ